MTRLRSLGLATWAACLGAVVAIAAERLLSDPIPASRAALDGDADGSLATELHGLRSAQERTAEILDRLESSLAGGRLTPPPVADARESLGGPDRAESLETLVRSLDDLRETLARESSETRDLLRSAPSFGGESLVRVRERHAETNWTLLTDLERDWRSDQAAASRSQYFQTALDLLRTYGPPDAIYRPKRGGIQLVYRAHPEGEAGTAWYFQLQDGFVVEFFIEDEQG